MRSIVINKINKESQDGSELMKHHKSSARKQLVSPPTKVDPIQKPSNTRASTNQTSIDKKHR